MNIENFKNPLGDSLERAKVHVKEKKELYIGIGVGLGIAGITCLIVRGRHAMTRGDVDGPVRVTVRPLCFLSNQKTYTSVVTVIEREGRGHPGYIVRCLETGEVFLTQFQAAKKMALSPGVLSGHLNGKFDNVDGYHFERIGALN